MGKVHQVGKVIIRVHPRDHLPPHFHAVGPDFEAFIEIETLAVLRGDLPSSVRKAVLNWCLENKALIAAEWNRINPRFPIA